jgi:hypothetical protein
MPGKRPAMLRNQNLSTATERVKLGYVTSDIGTWILAMIERRIRPAAGITLALLAAVWLTGCLPLVDLLSQEKGSGSSDQGVNRIAVVGVDHNIYVVGPSGEDRIAVSQDAQTRLQEGQNLRLYEAPTWAPGTGDLAFLRVERATGGIRETNLEVATAGDYQREVLLSSSTRAPFYLYWSPTGESISFLATGQEAGDLTFWLGRPGEGAAQIDSGQPYYWAYAPSGERILAHVGGSARVNPEEARLSLIHIEGEAQAFPSQPLSFQAPAYGPSGERVLAVVATGDGGGGLVVLGAQGELQAILSSGTGPYFFDWSPTGEYVAYTQGTASGGLTVLDVTDLDRPSVTHEISREVVGFWWSPNRDRLAYFVPARVPDSPDQEISYSAQVDEIWMQLAVLDVPSGEDRTLATFRPTRDWLQILPFFDQYQRSLTFWSPDGRQLLLAAQTEEGEPVILTVNADGSSLPKAIAEGVFAVWSWE